MRLGEEREGHSGINLRHLAAEFATGRAFDRLVVDLESACGASLPTIDDSFTRTRNTAVAVAVADGSGPGLNEA